MAIISPLFIYLLWKYGKKAIILMTIIICLPKLYLTYYHTTYGYLSDLHEWVLIFPNVKFCWYLIYSDTNLLQRWEVVFVSTSPLERSSSYLIGIIFGYLIENWQDIDRKDLPLRKLKIVKIFIALLIVSMIYIRYFSHLMSNRLLIAFLDSTTTTVFGALFMSCFIAFMHFSNNNVINKFYSMNIWKSFSRIALSIYLISPIVQSCIIFFDKEQGNFEAVHLVRKLPIWNDNNNYNLFSDGS